LPSKLSLIPFGASARILPFSKTQTPLTKVRSMVLPKVWPSSGDQPHW
jgi:hypothetical protein